MTAGDGDGRHTGPAGEGWVVVTGGAGFVGVNLADRLLERGESVMVLDNLSRDGVDSNLRWLRARHGDRVQYVAGDVRDRALVQSVVDGSSCVFHLAAQVAVTTSLVSPLEDHAINVIGTLNVLEAMRRSSRRPGLVFASTNKVYGALADVDMRRADLRYVPEDDVVRAHGFDEDCSLEFISPYGCSKGAADQYVLDYCRSFDLTAVVLRMSCIYGPRQQANSDQGWVTHFLRCALGGDRLTIYGDGRQVRDVLYVDDFLDALLAARRELPRIAGRAFNVGGGASNSLSLLEMIEIAEKLDGRAMDLEFVAPRPGDQRYFTADHRRFSAATGWEPETSPQAGIEQLWDWLLQVQGRPEAPAQPRGASWA